MQEDKKSPDQDGHISVSHALDDEQRVKVLSPGMLVAKRFFRNRLAMIGLIIIVMMFLFSFLGGICSPYKESQVFRTTEKALKDYAGAAYTTEFLYHNAEGEEFPAVARAKVLLAINEGKDSFEVKDTSYTLIRHSDNFYRIVQLEEIGTMFTLRGVTTFTETTDVPITDAMKTAFEGAIAQEETDFEVDGNRYSLTKNGRIHTISKEREIALATKLVFSGTSEEIELSYDFQYHALAAFVKGEDAFEGDGQKYILKIVDENSGTVFQADGKPYVNMSTLNVNPTSTGTFLPIAFKQAVQEAIDGEKESFSYTDEAGKKEEYALVRKNDQYMVRRYQTTQVNQKYAKPSRVHWLGTDGNGMDILTRLMYGGRISLLIGFVAVFIEVIIGVIIGGISGFFGKWVDTLMMRLVDIVNCIPAMPLYIILGAIMDFYKIDPNLRIYLLCVIIGVLSWPNIARMVRGQILSLREQEFMTAAEATGISVYHRIFKHLIPNVIPQLIVISTMGLGEVILMEATLSFLGLGVKYPCASWGSIINAVNDSYVMTSFWFVWIPAGMLILLTVLGFNFIGDGLRDAFDPKMKR